MKILKNMKNMKNMKIWAAMAAVMGTCINNSALSLSLNSYPRHHCLLFFTGGGNLFQPDIYSEFIDTIGCETNNNICVETIPWEMALEQHHIDRLKYKYKTVNAIGHSSGCSTLLSQCQQLDNIENVFLLDPVNNNICGHVYEDKYNTTHFKTISFIYALKSYKMTFDPIGLPFIPAFKLTRDDLDLLNSNCNIYEITFKSNGHSDILNSQYADFMHNTRLSVGNRRRDLQSKQKYFRKLVHYLWNVINYPTYNQ